MQADKGARNNKATRIKGRHEETRYHGEGPVLGMAWHRARVWDGL